MNLDTIRRYMTQMDLRELRFIVQIGDCRIWTEEALSIAAEVLLERTDEAPTRTDKGNCPHCGGVIEKGSIRIGSSFLSRFVVGMSWSRLIWRGEHGEETLLSQGQWSDAHRCQSCRSLMVLGVDR